MSNTIGRQIPSSSSQAVLALPNISLALRTDYFGEEAQPCGRNDGRKFGTSGNRGSVVCLPHLVEANLVHFSKMNVEWPLNTFKVNTVTV